MRSRFVLVHSARRLSVWFGLTVAASSACSPVPGDDASDGAGVSRDAIGVTSPWQIRQLGGGTVAPTVDVTPATGTHTISAVGLNGDTLGYVYRSFSGDGEITARVTRLAGGPAAGAGLMFRSSTDGNAAYLFVYLNGSGGVKFMRRAHIGVGTLGGNAQGPAGSWPPPVWLKVARSGSLFRAFTSQDGLAWTFVGDASTSGFGDSALAGMGVVSFSSTQRATAEFDSVDVGSLPSAWEPRLVGSGAGGSTKFDQGSNTSRRAAGASALRAPPDSFSGALRPVLGDGELVAKVTGPVGGTGAKIGIMLRGGLAADAPHVYLYLEPGRSGRQVHPAGGSGDNQLPHQRGVWHGSVLAEAEEEWHDVGCARFQQRLDLVFSGHVESQWPFVVHASGHRRHRRQLGITGDRRRDQRRLEVIRSPCPTGRLPGRSLVRRYGVAAAGGYLAAGIATPMTCETVVRDGRRSYPYPTPQPRGALTAHLPVVAEHVDRRSETDIPFYQARHASSG